LLSANIRDNNPVQHRKHFSALSKHRGHDPTPDAATPVAFDVSSEKFETSDTSETSVSETYVFDSKEPKAISFVSE